MIDKSMGSFSYVRDFLIVRQFSTTGKDGVLWRVAAMY